LEIIREIISISHDGYGRIWHPFYSEKTSNSLFINCKYKSQAIDLVMLLHSMFGTNNNISNVKKIKPYIFPKNRPVTTQCSIEFRTDKEQYILTKEVNDQYPVEVKLQSKNSTIAFYGNEANAKLAKMTSPIIVPGDRHHLGCQIYRTDCKKTILAMNNLIDFWAQNIGLDAHSFQLKSRSNWPSYGFLGREYFIETGASASVVSLLGILAQATIRTRKFGYCPAIVCHIDFEEFNEFEMKSIIDLTTNICREERLDVTIATSHYEQLEIDGVKNTKRM